MKLSEVPKHPAYVVFHDAFDNGAMDVYPAASLAEAKAIAERKQESLDQSGNDEAGIWAAYEKLPRKKVWKFHPEFLQAAEGKGWEDYNDTPDSNDEPLVQGICKDCGNGTLNNELNPAFELEDYPHCLQCGSTHLDIL